MERLEPTFGTSGKVTTALPDEDSNITPLTIQPDSKVVAVGAVGADYGAEYNLGLARFLPDTPVQTAYLP